MEYRSGVQCIGSIGYNYKRDRYSRLPFNQSTVMHAAYRVASFSPNLGLLIAPSGILPQGSPVTNWHMPTRKGS